MNWDAISAIAQAAAAIFVAATVIYLAVQVQKSSLATRSQTHYLVTAGLADAANLLAADRDVAHIYGKGMADPAALQEEEFLRFNLLGIAQFRRYENLFYQYRSGLIDNDFWDGHRENILWFFYQPGHQMWWKDKRLAFSKSFRDFLESSRPSDLKSPQSRRM